MLEIRTRQSYSNHNATILDTKNYFCIFMRNERPIDLLLAWSFCCPSVALGSLMPLVSLGPGSSSVGLFFIHGRNDLLTAEVVLESSALVICTHNPCRTLFYQFLDHFVSQALLDLHTLVKQYTLLKKPNFNLTQWLFRPQSGIAHLKLTFWPRTYYLRACEQLRTPEFILLGWTLSPYLF